MAGTLPGVEAARRRRFHHSSSDNAACWIRKSSSSSFLVQRSACYIHEHQKHDEKLGGAAREAKERLDEKLRNQRMKSLGHPRLPKHEDVVGAGFKRNRPKTLRWTTKLVWNWKAGEQEECSICLDRFKLCEYLVYLPCAHKFHSKCLSSWMECNAQCPCCRMNLT